MNTERRVRPGLAIAAGVFLACAATARADEESGLSLGVRLGYGIPAGGAMAGVSLGDVVSGQIPVWLDAWWRFDPSWRLGLNGHYGPSTLAGAFCPAPASCSGQNIGLGAQAAYAFAAGGSSPWVGAGMGVEWQMATVSAGGVKNELRLLGFEILDLQAGVDWRLSSRFALGPFASFALGQYLTVSSGGASVRVATALHEWLQLGVRGTFDL